jgi:hypothetical protein
MMNTKNNPYTVRTKETGDKVYLIKEGKRHWITTPEALKEIGFTLGEEKTISYTELAKLKEGKSISAGPQKKAPSAVPVQVEIKDKDGATIKGIASKPILGYKEEATLDDFGKFDA